MNYLQMNLNYLQRKNFKNLYKLNFEKKLLYLKLDMELKLFSTRDLVSKLNVFLIFIFIFSLSACSKIDMKQFENNTPKLDLFSFFEGETIAYGIFEDRFGNLKRQFRVNISGKIKNQTLSLDEDFLYDDGEQANRVLSLIHI